MSRAIARDKVRGVSCTGRFNPFNNIAATVFIGCFALLSTSLVFAGTHFSAGTAGGGGSRGPAGAAGPSSGSRPSYCARSTAGKVDLGDGDLAPLLRLRDRLAGVVEDGGDHPVALRIGVGAADDVDVVLAGAGRASSGLQPQTGQAITSAPRFVSSRATSGKKPS